MHLGYQTGPTNPASVMFSAIASCGSSAYFYFQGLPPQVSACALACWHHFTAAPFFGASRALLHSATAIFRFMRRAPRRVPPPDESSIRFSSGFPTRPRCTR